MPPQVRLLCHMTTPVRRVIYRSRTVRIVRLAVGLLMAAITLWIVLPALAPDQPRPSDVGLALGTDAIDVGIPRNTSAPPSVLALRIHTSECTNPVTIEGNLLRSTSTWYAEKRGHGSAEPKQAMVTLAGARVRQFVAGIDSGSFAVPHLTTGTVRMLSLTGRHITVHNDLLPLFREGDTTTATLNAPEWPEAMTGLGFRITADLVRSAGFESCYVDVPELFSFGARAIEGFSAYDKAQGTLRFISERTPTLTHGVPTDEYEHGDGPDEEVIGAGVVDVSIKGRTVVQSTIGEGGHLTADGVRYLCHAFVRTKLPIRPRFKNISRIR
jgi:hypothetical protein